MGKIDDKLASMGITLPVEQAPIANYVPGVRTGNLLYLSGLGPSDPNMKGKVGQDLTTEEGYEAAKSTGIGVIARLKGQVGDLDKVKRIVKLLTMVNCTTDFVDQPSVANGCSDLMVEVFGDKGKHARSAVGMGSLPGNIPVEIEIIVEIED
tara:strand:- start:18 stop:473 length:456 start_codon:yes stop_codon:yes gene_type:complete